MGRAIERFNNDDVLPNYKGLPDAGRSHPDGLTSVDRWLELRLFQEWVVQWRGPGATSKTVPVIPSAGTRGVVASHLGAG